ncbi:AtpZ/AtpI family protein [Paenibacillus sp. YYML68]|uniref:AtpZ/AtpI family protein n=1 Tax=Paenibacillus sp. YYML68 TaxID=2909250 RepID=UPI00249057CF|nr:AtpZ/AtpI family protein [Paenibacillus sp. YYML68]
MSQKDPSSSPWRAAALVGALGIDVVVCTLIGYFGGIAAGQHFGNPKACLLGGVFIGLLTGIVTAALVIKKVLEDQKE